MTGLANAQQSAIATSRLFTAEGKPVRYIRSAFVSGTGACMCHFEAGKPIRSSAQRLGERLHDNVQEPAMLGVMLACVYRLPALAQGLRLQLHVLAARVVIFGSIPFTDAMIVRHVEDRIEPIR